MIVWQIRWLLQLHEISCEITSVWEVRERDSDNDVRELLDWMSYLFFFLQLMFVPPDYNRTSSEQSLKKIMIPHGMGEAKVGPDIFTQQRCPVNTCTIVRDNPDDADLILFKDYVTHVGRRPYNQVSRTTSSNISSVIATSVTLRDRFTVKLHLYRTRERRTCIVIRMMRPFAGVDAVFFRMSLSHAECEERPYQLDGHISTWQRRSGTLRKVAILRFQCHTDCTNV